MGVPIRDDLILRMLDQIGEVVASVLSGLGASSVQRAEEELASAYVELTGSSRALVGRLGSEQILAILGAPARFNRERGYVLARLLEADAELAEAGAPEPEPAEAAAGIERWEKVRALVEDRRLKALDLYLEAARAGLDEEDLGERIDRLQDALAQVALPEPSHWRVFEHVAAIGRYADAEDLLFEAVDRFGPGPDTAARGRAFYRELEGRPDEELEAGALPRAEVSEGRAAFEAELGRALGEEAG